MHELYLFGGIPVGPFHSAIDGVGIDPEEYEEYAAWNTDKRDEPKKKEELVNPNETWRDRAIRSPIFW